MLELLATGRVVNDIASDARLGILPHGRLTLPAADQRKPELLGFDGGVTATPTVLYIRENNEIKLGSFTEL